MLRRLVPASVLVAMLVTPGFAGVRSLTQAAPVSAAAPLTVGVVLDVGGVNDKSFNHLAYLGLQEAKKQYGITGDYVVSNSQADYIPNLTRFARSKDVTVGVGFLMQQAMLQVAKQFPKKKFAMVDGCPADAKGNCHNLKNVANLFFKEQQSGYLVGVLAGLMEKAKIGAATHNTIGFMGGVSIPPVNRYIAGYVAGARAVDPSVAIKGGYSQSFTNQGTGNQIGRTQISSGADILFQVAGASGLGYLAAAQTSGKYGIGVDADQRYLGGYVITSALKKVDVAVALTIHKAQTGTFHGGDNEFDLKTNATGYAKPSSVVPAWIIKRVNLYEARLRSGKLHAPTTIPSF